jgi:hypothetical protein
MGKNLPEKRTMKEMAGYFAPGDTLAHFRPETRNFPGENAFLSLARAAFLAERGFPACYFALHDSLRDTGP